MNEYKLLKGNNLELLKTLEDNSIDAIVSEKEVLSLRYLITDDGRVINKKRNKEVKFNINHKGYLKARLYCPENTNSSDRRKPYSLHRLVAMFYLNNFSKQLQVNHKDGNKLNNNVDNLEMVTNSQNALHAWTYLDNNNDRRKKLNKCPITGKFLKK